MCPLLRHKLTNEERVALDVTCVHPSQMDTRFQIGPTSEKSLRMNVVK